MANHPQETPPTSAVRKEVTLTNYFETPLTDPQEGGTTRLTKQDVMRDLGCLLDDLVDGRSADIWLTRGEEEDTIFVSLEWTDDLAPVEASSVIPGWNVFACSSDSTTPEFIGCVEADWMRDDKINHIYQSLLVELPDLMPLPDVAPVPPTTEPEKEYRFLLQDEEGGAVLGIFRSLEGAKAHLMENEDFPEEHEWEADGEDYWVMPDLYSAQRWEVK